MKKFLALFDLHYGFERKNGHKVALHDPKALGVALSFAADFRPDDIILGGDMLDCGAVSHHNKGKPGRTEGLRLLSDTEGCRRELIDPLMKLATPRTGLTYIIGNHCAWLEDLIDDDPALEGIIDIRKLLRLEQWRVIPQGGYYNLGKLTFIHGDQLRGGEHVAKAAVIAYERSVRFGHFHTYQTYTKTSAIDLKLGRTGIACPCLCTKDPKYGEGAPNRWVQGFNWGYINDDGTYNDYITVITNGRATINGKIYKG